MKSEPITIRANEEMTLMLKSMHARPTTATLSVLELFTVIRKETIRELKGRFSRKEIMSLLDSYKRSTPDLHLLATNYIFVGHMRDAEIDHKCTSSNNANLNVLIEKIKMLNSAQVAILQQELWSYWNIYDTEVPDLEKFISRFV